MASMTVANLERAFPPSQIHLLNSLGVYNSLSYNSPQGSKDRVAYTSSPGEETSGGGITCQPAQPVTYPSIEFNQADTCFYCLRQGYTFMLITIEIARTVRIHS